MRSPRRLRRLNLPTRLWKRPRHAAEDAVAVDEAAADVVAKPTSPSRRLRPRPSKNLSTTTKLRAMSSRLTMPASQWETRPRLSRMTGAAAQIGIVAAAEEAADVVDPSSRRRRYSERRRRVLRSEARRRVRRSERPHRVRRSQSRHPVIRKRPMKKAMRVHREMKHLH